MKALIIAVLVAFSVSSAQAAYAWGSSKSGYSKKSSYSKGSSAKAKPAGKRASRSK